MLSRIDRSRPCWTWPGAHNDDGYAQVRYEGRTVYVHRLMYETVIGPVPTGLELDHLCRNHGCVNPADLEPVTSGENTRRGEPARRTHCPRGHEYDQENTYRMRRGGRQCRACHREQQRRRRRQGVV